MTFTWPLVIPPTPSVFATSSVYSTGISVGNPFYYPPEYFLTLIESLLPDWYLQPLISPGPGYEFIQTMAAIFSRVSLAIGRTECSMFNLYASGGVLSVGTVQFYRASLGSGAFTVKRGTVVQASKSARTFVLAEDVVFGLADFYKNGTVEASTPAGEYNVPGPIITADGTLLEGEIDYIPLPFLDPIYAEPAIQVRQVGDMRYGQAPALDQLGLDRRIARNPNESDDTYRERIRRLPDTVTPAAIHRQLDSIFLPMGLTYDLIETWENRYQSCWDAPLGDLTSPTQGTLLEGTFAYDDTRTDGFYGRWMGEEDHRGAFIVVVPQLQWWEERGEAYDDPALLVEDFASLLGRRATSAYDSPVLDTPEIYSGAYDAGDRAHDVFYLNLYNLLRDIKGGGVRVSIELDPAFAG